MATAVTIPISEYLETSYRPDCEYIDGEVVEKNMGKWEHSRLQAILAALFYLHEEQWGVMVATEWRTQVSAFRVRLPDVLLVLAGPQTPVLEVAPLLIVEILSPDDTYTDTQRRAQDYLHMGVNTIWIIDPETRSARQCVDDVWTGTTHLTVPGTEIVVELPALFAKLDASR